MSPVASHVTVPVSTLQSTQSTRCSSNTTTTEGALSAAIGEFFDAPIVDYDKLQGLIRHCRVEAMTGSVEHQVALEILVPLSIESLPLEGDEVSSVKSSAQAFFGGWLNPYAQERTIDGVTQIGSDIGTKGKLLDHALAMPSGARGEQAVERVQQMAQDIVSNVSDFVTYEGNSPGVSSVDSAAPQQAGRIRNALRNTCFFDATLNVFQKNPRMSAALANSSPDTAEWQNVKALMQSPQNVAQRNSDYVQLHHVLTQELRPPQGANSAESQHDAIELIGLIAENVGLLAGLLNDGIQFSATGPHPELLIEQLGGQPGTVATGFEAPGADGHLLRYNLEAVCIHNGARISNENGVNAAGGHYYSLVKGVDDAWTLYSYQQPVRGFRSTDIAEVLGELARDRNFSAANFKGVYARQS
jgi:hypothetical protein